MFIKIFSNKFINHTDTDGTVFAEPIDATETFNKFVKEHPERALKDWKVMENRECYSANNFEAPVSIIAIFAGEEPEQPF